MDVERTREFFRHRYYRLPVMLFKVFGFWSYQSTRYRSVVYILLFFYASSHFVPLMMTIMNNLDDWDYLMEICVSILSVATSGSQFFFTILNSQKLPIILDRIRKHWKIWAQESEADVLHDYAQRGVKMMTAYGVLLYTSCNLWVILPMLPTIIGIISSNVNSTKQLPIPIDYSYIDVDKYYFYIVLHIYGGVFVTFLGTLGFCSWFIVKIQHGCGLFAAVRRKLERLGEKRKSSRAFRTTDFGYEAEVDLKHLRSCIDRHNDAVEFTKLIEAYYSWCFFVNLGINMLLMSITGLQVTNGTIYHRETIKFLAATVVLMLHLYGYNLLAENLTDHSISIRHCILKGQWYRLPLKTQKILLVMLMRCNVPCKLTAGKVSTLCIETFGVFCNTSLSYFMMLRTMGSRLDQGH